MHFVILVTLEIFCIVEKRNKNKKKEYVLWFLIKQKEAGGQKR